jgi:hypothetical protein
LAASFRDEYKARLGEWKATKLSRAVEERTERTQWILLGRS